MEPKLPIGRADMAHGARPLGGPGDGYRVVAGAVSLDISELRRDGFAVQADGRPPLRGFAEIFRGDERVLYGLVTCAWTEDGMIGYEFKHDNSGCNVATDHVPPDHAGPIGTPGTD